MSNFIFLVSWRKGIVQILVWPHHVAHVALNVPGISLFHKIGTHSEVLVTERRLVCRIVVKYLK